MRKKIFQEPEYIEYISTLTKKDWMKLTCFIPEIENTTEFETKIDYSKKADYSEDTIYLPYYQEIELVWKFRNQFIELNLQLDFDWSHWEAGRQFISYLDQHINNLDLLTILKLLTAIIRNDRFCEGALASRFADGNILLLLKRLKEITNT
jgi:hypothetical protein